MVETFTYLYFSVAKVNYLRAEARRDRWVEEEAILLREVDWTSRYFHHLYLAWSRRATDAQSPGLVQYALRQADLWNTFEVLGRKTEVQMVSSGVRVRSEYLKQHPRIVEDQDSEQDET